MCEQLLLTIFKDITLTLIRNLSKDHQILFFVNFSYSKIYDIITNLKVNSAMIQLLLSYCNSIQYFVSN
jgi:hypothetical protein